MLQWVSAAASALSSSTLANYHEAFRNTHWIGVLAHGFPDNITRPSVDFKAKRCHKNVGRGHAAGERAHGGDDRGSVENVVPRTRVSMCVGLTCTPDKHVLRLP